MYHGYGAGMAENKNMVPTKIQTFIVRMNPVAKGRPRFTKTGRAYTPKKTKEATEVIAKRLKRIVVSRFRREFLLRCIVSLCVNVQRVWVRVTGC